MSESKDTSTNFDDDFHFDEFDLPHDEALSSENQKTKIDSSLFNDDSGKIKWDLQKRSSRKLIVLSFLVVLIIFFAIYHFVSNWNNPFANIGHLNASKIPPIATNKTVLSPAQIALAQQESTEHAQQQAAEALASKAHDLDQTINQQQKTIDQLQGNMNALQDSVNTLNSAVTNMSQQLSAIDAKLTKPVEKQPAKIMGPPPPPAVTYIIKAMVPGRAWLQSSDGKALSVAVGNSVPQHGTVASIDLTNGQVLMSDGSVFSYDINGN